MITIIGLLLTYIGFGLLLFGIRENYNLSTIINDALRSVGTSTGDKLIIIGIIIAIIGTILILINAKWGKKRRY